MSPAWLGFLIDGAFFTRLVRVASRKASRVAHSCVPRDAGNLMTLVSCER